ncbi:vacuolar protein sorting-associated protein 9 [Phytophthora pseudosyringae]|uniref:Vacuolar protein sorting-associated protein 9 n=1 Tax=Phytophthora pseudosyringae TaxID=221518 RepID=A0A8T1VIG0_9STRA|nr:vacuolar protein sorting-associated protein 9 [Phytophthora pseudosyringae]
MATKAFVIFSMYSSNPRSIWQKPLARGPAMPRRRGVSKNCANAKKQQLRARRRRIREEFAQTRRLQDQIQELDRRLTLFDARGLRARQCAQTAALTTMETYYRCMARGYDPVGAPEQAQQTRNFLLSTFDEQLKTPDFTGLEHLMKQWELLSVYHKSVVCRLDDVELVDHYEKLQPDRDVHVVATHGVTTLEISRATIESVFPHIVADERLTQSLMGKRYSFSFTLIAYVDAVTGRVFQLESKIDLTSALMDLLQDPFATVQMVKSTTMNKRGNLLLREDVREDQNIIENGFL